jgi:hypothetical protein
MKHLIPIACLCPAIAACAADVSPSPGGEEAANRAWKGVRRRKGLGPTEFTDRFLADSAGFARPRWATTSGESAKRLGPGSPARPHGLF